MPVSMQVSSWAGWTRVAMQRAMLPPLAYPMTYVACGRGGDFPGQHLPRPTGATSFPLAQGLGVTFRRKKEDFFWVVPLL